MARTFLSQPNQIFHSENYNDAVPAGATLQTTSTTVETDLNALRSQVRRLLWAKPPMSLLQVTMLTVGATTPQNQQVQFPTTLTAMQSLNPWQC